MYWATIEIGIDTHLRNKSLDTVGSFMTFLAYQKGSYDFSDIVRIHTLVEVVQ